MKIAELDLERSVIGALLLLGNEKPPGWAATVEPEDFTNNTHKAIMTAVAELLGSGDPVDAITVADKLTAWGMRQHCATVAELADHAPTTANLEYHARRLVERGQTIDAQRQLRNLLSSETMPPASELRSALAEVAKGLEPRCGGGGLVPISQVIPGVMRELLTESETGGSSIRTGLRDLDRAFRMLPGDLTIMGARPSMGKTALAGHLARAASRNISKGAVAVFSLEMSAVALVRRMLASESSTDSREELPKAAAKGQVMTAVNALHRADIWIDERPQMSVEAIRSALTKLGNIQLVAVDYMQLMKLGKGERHDLRVGAVSKGLKAMAKEFRCHVLALSQLSRKVEDRSPPVPRLSDLRDSGNIEEDADNVLLLYRPHYYNPSADPTELRIDVAKQRNGPTPGVQVRWRERVQRVEDWNG